MTDAQFEALAPYETYFDTAIRTSSVRNPGRPALNKIADTLEAITGRRRTRTFGCGRCVVNLLRDAGALYFKEKNAREARKVELSETETEMIMKADIKTEKI